KNVLSLEKDSLIQVPIEILKEVWTVLIPPLVPVIGAYGEATLENGQGTKQGGGRRGEGRSAGGRRRGRRARRRRRGKKEHEEEEGKEEDNKTREERIQKDTYILIFT
uniref:Uncharacterized protein n=1 Tax=Strongyloides stercoralis TaxID=6248 RepID=A0AAF5I1T7_STRER